MGTLGLYLAATLYTSALLRFLLIDLDHANMIRNNQTTFIPNRCTAENIILA